MRGIQIMPNGKKYLVENGIYTPVVKESGYEESGGTYREKTMYGTMVLVPNIEEPEAIGEVNLAKLNRWGQARLKYLMEENPKLYQELREADEIQNHLMEIQEEVSEFMWRELPRWKKSYGLKEEMKNTDILGYEKQVNNILSSLREIVLQDIIYR